MATAYDDHGRPVKYTTVVSHHRLRRVARIRATLRARRTGVAHHVIHARAGTRWEVVT